MLLSLNNCIKFGAVIIQNKVSEHIFNNKKTKQRYLDYVYKIALKRTFEQLITQSIINPNDVNNIYVYTDEHTTANDGRYELHEALEIEFKIGTTNYVYMTYFPPIFKNIKNVDVKFLNSSSVTLIRAADIVANNIFYKATKSFIVNLCDGF